MTPRTKNLAAAGGAVALLGIIGVNVLVSPPPAAPAPIAAPARSASPDETAPAPSPSAIASAPVDAAVPPAPARRSYAVGLHDLQGLPPDAAPGTTFELWVTWEPPVTEEPRLDRLIGDAVLERVVPGTVPEAPVTVLLSVPAERTGDLIYADTFGRLSVVLPS
ncbi:MAG TPA: hypothetical protein VG318_02335 [Actinomycetota bacterium]|nr:hypothetical protein [Actinomycetota bacterium]